MKRKRTDLSPDPRSTEASSHEWTQICALDRKQGLGEWTRRKKLCYLKISARVGKMRKSSRDNAASQRLMERWARQGQ